MSDEIFTGRLRYTSDHLAHRLDHPVQILVGFLWFEFDGEILTVRPAASGQVILARRRAAIG